MELDQTDWDIINALSREYQSNSTIAAQLGLSEGTVRHRMKKLRTSGAVKVRALRDPNVLAKQQLVMVAVSLAQVRLLDAKAEEISRLDNVLSVVAVSGQYDLVAEVLVDSNRGLVRFLTQDLSTVSGITKTESFVVLKSYNKFV